MDEFENLGEERKEKVKADPTDAIHLDEYGIVVSKENLDKIQGKITKLLDEGFTINVQAIKRSEFKMK